ncbi:GGDEF and EAL domain-containing protein [Rhodoferax sp.]|uniref:bifunctional diguanylate cyclase/phosphodiesterase n=1 Tax=Rhodoferax sp. TaxID=50421 RepID=UPI0025F3E23F|nr:GGDEF and EAL domain-containing protein [Rhodoferax sp.]
MRTFRPSLRVAISVPFALILATTVALQALTQQDNTNRLIDTTSVRILDALTVASSNRLVNFLEEPFRIQSGIADAIGRHGLYTPNDLGPLYRHLRGVYQDLYLNQTQISALSFGSAAGEYAGMRREDAGAGFSLMLKDASTQGQLRIYKGDHPGDTVAGYDGYDPRGRPWYAPIAQSGKAGWSAIYANYDEQAEVTISASAPVKVGNQFLGVMEADVKLNGLNQFLHDEPLRGTGIIAITDSEGELVAFSEPGSVLADGHSSIPRGQRLRLSESSNPVLRAAAQPVADAPTESASGFQLAVNGKLYICRVAPYSDVRGLNWRIVMLVPESDLLGGIRSASQRNMAWIIGFASLGFVLGLWAIGWVTRPIQRTAQAANQLALGQWDTPIESGGAVQETDTLVHAFNAMAQRLQRAFNNMRDQLRYDSPTQLLTRRGLLEEVHWDGTRPAVLCLLGLDGFRAINDNVGHATGERLLQAIAGRMRAQMPSQVWMARVGGDEFALLHLDTEQAPADIATQALQLFATPFASGGDEIMVTASVGVVAGQLPASDLPEWLRNASVVLGEVKRRHRGSWGVFEPSMMEQSLENARLANELRQALERGQFRVHYQTVIALATGCVTGVEALVRWQSPARGLVPPGIFIPIAESSDLILALGDWVLRTATRDVAQHLAQLPPNFDLHVNVSARQLIQSDFGTTLKQALRESGLPPQNLTLELTESVLIEQNGQTVERLREIRAQGVKIAIDDFGTGYSSLAYLGRLPFDCLKIDQSFVRTLCSSPQDASIVAAVLQMAKGFGVDVVAEGVETEAQAQRLQEMGCHHAQGYWFGRPLPWAQVQWGPHGPGGSGVQI